MKPLIAALALALGIGTASAATPPKWEHFRSRLSGNVIIIKAACESEDSLRHLRLLDKDAGRIVLGCHHRGY